jgi:hypothetical protein
MKFLIFFILIHIVSSLDQLVTLDKNGNVKNILNRNGETTNLYKGGIWIKDPLDEELINIHRKINEDWLTLPQPPPQQPDTQPLSQPQPRPQSPPLTDWMNTDSSRRFYNRERSQSPRRESSNYLSRGFDNRGYRQYY